MDRGSGEKYFIAKVPRKKFDGRSEGVTQRSSTYEREEQF